MTQKNHTWRSVVLWSVISAAFIGPGTVTTAVTAGSTFRLDLLWAVIFATLGCIVLQEIAARITLASGMNLGQAFTKKFGTHYGRILQLIIGLIVIAGCAAYEAGNILGAVAGLELITHLDTQWLTVALSVAAFLLLWFGSPKWISSFMMLLVALMGVAFTVLAFMQPVTPMELIKPSVVPVIPPGAELVVLGLIGTTIVPYNLFLGSGISKGQTIPLMRIGVATSILIGGFITATILVAGISVDTFTSFPALFTTFETKLGTPAALAMALGLFAAGFSSAITSPYASAVIARTVFGISNEKGVRLIWCFVLLTGFAFGISNVKPVPVILAVQALNGLILPLLVIFLITMVNDASLVGKEHAPAVYYNIVLLFILGAVLLIGLNNINKAITSGLSMPAISFSVVLLITIIVTGLMAWVVFRKQDSV